MDDSDKIISAMITVIVLLLGLMTYALYLNSGSMTKPFCEEKLSSCKTTCFREADTWNFGDGQKPSAAECETACWNVYKDCIILLSGVKK